MLLKQHAGQSFCCNEPEMWHFRVTLELLLFKVPKALSSSPVIIFVYRPDPEIHSEII